MERLTRRLDSKVRKKEADGRLIYNFIKCRGGSASWSISSERIWRSKLTADGTNVKTRTAYPAMTYRLDEPVIPLTGNNPCYLCRRFYWSENGCTDIYILNIVYKAADLPYVPGQGDS